MVIDCCGSEGPEEESTGVPDCTTPGYSGVLDLDGTAPGGLAKDDSDEESTGVVDCTTPGESGASEPDCSTPDDSADESVASSASVPDRPSVPRDLINAELPGATPDMVSEGAVRCSEDERDFGDSPAVLANKYGLEIGELRAAIANAQQMPKGGAALRRLERELRGTRGLLRQREARVLDEATANKQIAAWSARRVRILGDGT